MNGESAQAVAVWQDSAAADVFVCAEHDNLDAVTDTFMALGLTSPFGMPRPSADLTGQHSVLCQHPDHKRGRGRPPVGERVEARIPADDLAALDVIAAERDVTRAELVREAVAAFVRA